MEIVMSVVMLFLTFAVIFLLLHSMGLAYLSYRYRSQTGENARQSKPESQPTKNWPAVTIQLPLYNEKYVVERLINAVSVFDYPRDKIDIQILDDSTDETSSIVAGKVEELAEQGFNVSHIQRTNRQGFKAGALKHGTGLSNGEFIAIFDADFIPQPDFLKRVMPQFENNKLAMVQTRWAHLNSDYSFLTRLLSFALDFHFSVEQRGRNVSGHLINFNGTAGVWRKSAIIDSGGWESDTLTEDLDLSYRAQVRGWNLKFDEETTSPSELPVTIGAIKSQQFRWMKGGAENARKNLQRVFRSGLSFGTKWNAAVHLMGPLLPLCILYILTTSAILLFYYGNELPNTGYNSLIAVMPIVTIMYIFSYWTAFSKIYRNLPIFSRIVAFAGRFLGFAAVFMSLSPLLSSAAIEGLCNIKSPFVRTPKLNIVKNNDGWFDKIDYAGSKLTMMVLVEILVGVFLLTASAYAFHIANYSLMFFFALPSAGFIILNSYNFRHGTA